MADYPSLPLWTDAYLADTHPDLTLEEHGCYLLLLIAAWRRPRCALPDDDAWFCRWLNVHGNKWRRLRSVVLERFFDRVDEGFGPEFVQKRLRKERDFLEKQSRNQREKAEKRWAENSKKNDVGDATGYAASGNAPTPTPTPTPTKNNPAWAGRQERPSPHAASAPRDPFGDGAAPGADASGRRPTQDKQTTIINSLVAIIGPKSRKLAAKLVNVCGVDNASKLLHQIEEAEDPRAYVAAAIKNAELGANGPCGGGQPRLPDFAAVMNLKICDNIYDDWEYDDNDRWTPTEHSKYRTPKAVYRSWYESSFDDGISLVGREHKALIEQLFEVAGPLKADDLILEASDDKEANDRVPFLTEALEKARTRRN